MIRKHDAKSIVRYKKTGLTLAEVLITLGIIGVVAAMTIPGLLEKNFERRTVSHLRETQSILSQAIRMAEEEYGEVEGWGINGNNQESAELIFENLKSFIKVGIDCGVTDTEGKCTILSSYKYLNGGSDTVNYSSSANYYKIKLLNGSSVWWRGAKGEDYDTYTALFFVDVNGSALPNVLGKDLFCFYLFSGGQGLLTYNKFQTFGTVEESCNKSSDGWYCAYYVLTNNNMNYLR